MDKIKKEEIALDNLKAKYNQLASYNKVPASLTSTETLLKKNEKEVQKLEEQYDETIEKIGQKQIDLEWAKNNGNPQEISLIQNEQNRLDEESIDLASKLEDAREESIRLKNEVEQLKLNPMASMEAVNLKAKIEETERSLRGSQEEANELAKNIEKASKNRLSRLGVDASVISKGFKDVNSKIDKFKNKMSRLIGTAMVFSLIRSGLSSMSKGFINLLKSNDKFSESLNQIKANLMTAFTPIYNSVLPSINSLMNALTKVTGTIAVFINGLFGKTASQAKENAKELYNQAKATTALGKAQEDLENLGSFDKLEVNQEEKTTSSGISDANSGNINFDGEITYSQKLLDILNGIKDFVNENGGIVLAFLGGLAVSILAIKLGLDGIKALGIGIMILGIITAITSIIDYLKDPTFENFGKVIAGIGLAIVGLGVILGSLPLVIAGLIVLIVGILVSKWEEIKTFFSNIIQWIFDHLDEIGKKFGLIGVFISSLLANGLSFVMKFLDDILNAFKKIFTGIIDLIVGIFTGDWKRAWNGVKEIFQGIFDSLLAIAKAPLNGLIALLNTLIDGLNFFIGKINSFSIDVPDWVPFMGGKKFGFNIPTINKIPFLATGAVIPPNSQFAAILGDQKHGNNLEAPESLIRKIVREESGGKEVVLNATFIMQCETEEIGRAALKGIRLLENLEGEPYFVR